MSNYEHWEGTYYEVALFPQKIENNDDKIKHISKGFMGGTLPELDRDGDVIDWRNPKLKRVIVQDKDKFYVLNCDIYDSDDVMTSLIGAKPENYFCFVFHNSGTYLEYEFLEAIWKQEQ